MEIQKFNEDAMLVLSQYDQARQKWEKTVYVKVPGGQTNNFNPPAEREEPQPIYCGANAFGQNGSNCGATKDKGIINPQNATAEKISERQFNYLLLLAEKHGMSGWDLDKKSLNIFGVRLAYLTKVEAHNLIRNLMRQKAA